MNRSMAMFAGTFPLALAALTACSATAEPSGAAPEGSTTELGTLQSQPVPGTTMTMIAGTPEADSYATDSVGYGDGSVRATMTWTGSGTYSTGACLLNQVLVAGSPVPCSSDGNCTSYASGWTGGSAHCRAPNNGVNGTAKSCWVRPGPRSTFCVGTPADGNSVTVPATKTTGWVSAYSYLTYSSRHEQWDGTDLMWSEDYISSVWMLDGCYLGCASTAPSDSSALNLSSTYDWDVQGQTSVGDGAWVTN